MSEELLQGRLAVAERKLERAKEERRNKSLKLYRAEGELNAAYTELYKAQAALKAHRGEDRD